MDNLRSVLNIVLSKIPPIEILDYTVMYNNITREEFLKLGRYYVKNYSNDELENLYAYMNHAYEEQSEYFRGRSMAEESRNFSIYDIILIFVVQTLAELDGEPVCRYEHLLRWRMTSHALDEDLFTTAFIAYRDIRDFDRKRTFAWRPVIRHNNVYLNKILSKGMADNHFHLKGSAPQFPLSWLSMMNDVCNKRFRKQIEEYGRERLSTIYDLGGKNEDLYISYLKAALIRVYLYYVLNGKNFFKYYYPDSEKDNQQEERYDETRKEKDEKAIFDLLKDSEAILEKREFIQNVIMHAQKNTAEGDKIDYALNGDYIYLRDNVNSIMSGERWLMYKMFFYIYTEDMTYEKYFNLFYAYLVIKETIRSELVETNGNVGFDNFERYQDRKEDFIEGTKFEPEYIKMAIRGTILNQNIKYLEARITPKKSAEENRKIISKYEKVLNNELNDRFFYVFHFIKERDTDENCNSELFCRHFRKRRGLRLQAQEIAAFRRKYPAEAKRVKGIDACSKEIYCRPEVFAQTYRFLRNHVVYSDREAWEDGKSPYSEVKQLSMTYHIGEDFLDIVDGLRAIDEAVHLLQLNCGSRLEHALALGVDIDEYYRVKNNRILINQQDYLDNLVWIYYKIKQFGITGFDDIILLIEKEYGRFFRNVYGAFIDRNSFDAVLREAQSYFKERNQTVGMYYENCQYQFTIAEYFNAYQLRGDNPECYIEGYFKELEDTSEWNRYSVCREYPKDFRIRYRPETAYLYHLYHYNSHVKQEGRKEIEISIEHRMIACIKAIQEEMLRWFSTLGIGIESNPSSNYFIGTFERYDKHPIFRFFNIGLASSREELAASPQIPVCINTDDQGIFSTYLDNEYALLALALEKQKDENGKSKYSRAMVYRWIENLREQSIRLSFMEQIYGIEK